MSVGKKYELQNVVKLKEYLEFHRTPESHENDRTPETDLALPQRSTAALNERTTPYKTTFLSLIFSLSVYLLTKN